MKKFTTTMKTIVFTMIAIAFFCNAAEAKGPLEFSKTYKIRVSDGLESLLRATCLQYDELILTHFSEDRGIHYKRSVKIATLMVPMTDDELVRVLDAHGLWKGNVTELLTLSAQFPEIISQYPEGIIAYGSFYGEIHRDFYHNYYPVLTESFLGLNDPWKGPHRQLPAGSHILLVKR